VRSRPNDLTFVLVDYKGGSAFNECARLPHVLASSSISMNG
jgi:S-DNA-T family DNA segregation ATPase FtsK/SpoIIIE